MENRFSRGRPRKATKNDLSSRAMKIYGEHGISNISFNEMCRRLDIAKPSIYRTFGDEDGLVSASLEIYAAEVLPSMVKIIRTDRKFPLQLEELQDVIMTVTLANREGCLLLQARRQKGNLGKKTKAFLAKVDKQFLSDILVWLEDAKMKGGLRKHVNVAIAAQLILSKIGFVQYALASGASEEDTRAIMALSLSSLIK